MKKSGVNLKEVMNTEILPCAKAGDFEFWVKTAVGTLEKHAEGKPRARVFAHALWGLASDAEWAAWEPWIKAALTADGFASMAPLFVREAAAAVAPAAAPAPAAAAPAADAEVS